nr:RNA-directed DNA polymerase, eukaryota [Tanacetum cinerariifolium]
LHGIDLVSFITPKLGNSANTSFWDVAWCGDIAFKSLVPRLYALESMKNVEVASKLLQRGLEFSFRCNPRGGVEQAQFERLKEMGISKTRWIKEVSIKINVHAYGTVVDVYIPNRKSKVGKHYAFVRFIRVDNLDRLVNNLCTVWNGRLHMHANVVRFDRPAKPMKTPARTETPVVTTYASVSKGIKPDHVVVASIPSMVLDDSHIVHRDLSLHVMGDVKQFMSIQKLPTILSKEGFPNVKLTYLGGLWVMMEFSSLITKEIFLHHVGVALWFNTLSNPQPDFVSKERIVRCWSWKNLEESKDDLFARNRLCIKTKQEDNIMEKFKILIRGKAYTIRAKELFTWVPIFQEDIRSEFFSDDESVHADERKEKHPESNNHVLDEHIDDDVVSDTYCEHDEKEEEHHESYQKNQTSEDPFHIYNILRKQDNEANSESDKTCSYPPGFTPENEVNKKLENKVSSPYDGFKSCVMADSQHIEDQISNLDGQHPHIHDNKTGGSILKVMDGLIKLGQTMGYSMDGCLKDMAKKDWVKELNISHKVNFLALQETKLVNFSVMDAKCIWVSDNSIAVYGTWMSTKSKILIITVYALQSATEKRSLWQYIAHLINHWKGDCIVMGDFNEVRSTEERLGSNFNVIGANDFIANSGLIDLHLEGYSFTWSHPSAQKMSKLDRFLLSDDLLSTFPQISSICLDRHLSDHRPILLREIFIDFDQNDMVRFKKKLQGLKKFIREWVAEKKNHNTFIKDTKLKLADIDEKLDCGEVNDELLLSCMNLMHSLQEKKIADARDNFQKSKVKWAVEGDENTKYFHGIINKNRANLSIRGVMVDGEWIVDPMRVKEAFKNHFAFRFQHPSSGRCHINFSFPNRLSKEQQIDLESHVSTDEIRKAAIQWFFEHCVFPRGCNSSFVALILKGPDAKFVSDFHPISLISSIYKVVTKNLANRLSSVILDLVSDVQTTFISNRQILDGLFIINELLSWCKSKKKQAMVFKVDFAKAYELVRWDFLDDVLRSFGFGSKWRSWISGCLSSAMASVILNGSPTSEFHVQCRLKQGDPLAHYLFILVMKSLHLSFSRVIDAGMFKGLLVDNSVMISHLFYADDAIFIGEWSDSNFDCILQVLQCFYFASGLKINVQKSNLMGVGINPHVIAEPASKLECSILNPPFKYMGVTVGTSMSKVSAWNDTLAKLQLCLSKWKSKTLSIGGRLTLLKAVLGAYPIYAMSLYKVPKTVKMMESIRSKFFNGVDGGEKKIIWIKWSKVLAAKRTEDSLWFRTICAIHGNDINRFQAGNVSPWVSILRKVHSLNSRGIDLVSHCNKRVGDGLNTSFWHDNWIDGLPLKQKFPHVYALESNKLCTVADKRLAIDLDLSFRRNIRGDRWVWDLNGSGDFFVKDVRSMIDDFMLPNDHVATRWIKCIPIKANVFAWKVRHDILATKNNLMLRGISVDSPLCPICSQSNEDVSHIFFCCDLAYLVSKRVCRWHGADVFNRFISNARLEEVPLDGCSFTWCHRSATKMDSWKDAPIIESNALVRMMKKLKYLKEKIQVEKKNSLEAAQKEKIKWAIEGDENSKYYHGVINKKRNQLSIRSILVKGTWIDSPSLVKSDNSSFIILIPKTLNANMVKDYRPISLIGSMYKIISKILANLLVVVLGGLVNKIQSTFVDDKQILDVGVGLFKGIELAPSLNFSHMFYADDAIFMGQWSESNIDTIVKVLECFNRASGLRINMTKRSKVGGCMSRIQSWNETIERMACRLSKWKLKTLSIGVPKKVLHRMESMRSYFFNGAELSGKKSVWVKWKHALASKDKGGLGVSSLFTLNRALMFKWVWRFNTQCFSLWARVIKALHGYDGKIGQKVKSCYPSLWLDIIHEVEMFKSRGIDLLSHSGLDVSFRRPPRGGAGIQQFEHMKEKVEGCILADMMDRWLWALEGSGEFTITSVRKMIDDFMLPEVSSKTRWIKAVPIKVNVHAWKVKLDGLPTRLNISRRGINIESILCPMCGKAVESTSHIFFTCQMSKEILRKIFRWWDIDYMKISSYEEWLYWILNMRLSVKSK